VSEQTLIRDAEARDDRGTRRRGKSSAPSLEDGNPPEFPFKSGEITHRIEDGGNYLEFKWAPATRGALSAPDNPPISSLKKSKPRQPRPRLAWRDGNPAGNDQAERNIDAT
jgi:hypothetical protein